MSDETTTAAPAASTTAAPDTTAATPAPDPEPGSAAVPVAQSNGQAAPAADAPPVAGELTLTSPEGYPFSEAQLARFTELAKAKGWSQEQAQDYVNDVAESSAASLKASMDRLQVQRETWRGEVQSDPEIGGKNFERTIHRCHQVMEKIDGDRQLRDFMDRTGLGDHPVVVRAFEQIARYLIPDDSIQVTGAPTGTQPFDPARMYPSMRKA